MSNIETESPMKVNDRVVHYDGSPSTHGIGTILEDDRGGEFNFVVKWDQGHQDVYSKNDISLLEQGIYADVLRRQFANRAERLGYKVSSAYGPYDDEDTQKAWIIWLDAIAFMSPGGELEFNINY